MVLLKAIAILAGLFIAYFAYWTYQDREAASAANQFCNSVVVGSTVSDAVTQAKATGARYSSSSSSNPQQFFFQGPIFNGYYCDLGVVDGKVVSRQVTQAKD